MSLLINTSLQQIEILLRDVISLALKRRLPAAVTIAALRATATTSNGQPVRRNRDLIFVTATGIVYKWSKTSTAADDGDLVVKPADGTTSGRWLKTTSAVLLDGDKISEIADGYFKEVILHNGDFSDETLKSKIFGKAPCVAIHFAGASNELISQIPGALYEHDISFEIWTVARNFRDEEEGAVGPALQAEIDDDPGVLALHGLVKKLLADNATGEQIGESGIKMIDFGGERLEFSDEAGRVFVMALEVNIRAAVHNPDAAKEFVALSRIDVQREQAQAGSDGVYDEGNAVTSGLTVAPGTGYLKSIAAGSATIGGVAVPVLASSHTFGIGIDTYRDLKTDGTWVFTEVSRGQEPSAPAAGRLRVGITVTNDTGVAADSFLCSVVEPYEDPDQIGMT